MSQGRTSRPCTDQAAVWPMRRTRQMRMVESRLVSGLDLPTKVSDAVVLLMVGRQLYQYAGQQLSRGTHPRIDDVDAHGSTGSS